MAPAEVEIQPTIHPMAGWLSVSNWMIISDFGWISRSCRLVNTGWIPTKNAFHLRMKYHPINWLISQNSIPHIILSQAIITILVIILYYL